MELDIIVPIFNEEVNVKTFYEETQKVLKDIKHNYIFIDDGSTDKTLNALEEIYKNDDNNVKIISFSRNFGKEAAMYAGLQYSKAKFACIIDANNGQKIKYLAKMYNFLEDNPSYDSICMCQKQKKKRVFKKFIYKLINKLFDVEIVDVASDFRMFRKNVVVSINKICEKNRFSKGLFSYIGFNTYYDYYEIENKKTKHTKKGQKKSCNNVLDSIMNFSSKPLRVFTWIGLFISVLSLICLIVIIVKTLISGIAVPGYVSIMSTILFFGGIQLIFLGIIGEYIGKTYNETKNRPLFIAKKKYGFDEEIL